MLVKMSKKRVSRKLKSAWRKHIDISDVEQFLEEQRQDERTGRREDQADTELFVDEKKPAQSKPTLRETRKKKFTELPKSMRPLLNTSNVPPIAIPSMKKPIVPPVRPRTVVRRVKKPSRTRHFATATEEDIWAKDDIIPDALQSEWIEKDVLHHTMKHTGRPLITNLPKKMDHKHKKIPATTELLKGVLSYNPAIDDYMHLKNAVVRKEEAIIKKEQYLDRVLTQKIVKTTRDERYHNQLREMSEGLVKAEQSESEEENPETSEPPPPPVIEKRKKYVSKTKLKLRRQQFHEERLVQRELQKLAEIDRADQINGELNAVDRRLKRKALTRAKLAARRGIKIPMDFVEPERLSGSLRTIQPLNTLIATGVPKARKIGILQKTQAQAAKAKRRVGLVRYTRSSHKVPLE